MKGLGPAHDAPTMRAHGAVEHRLAVLLAPAPADHVRTVGGRAQVHRRVHRDGLLQRAAIKQLVCLCAQNLSKLGRRQTRSAIALADVGTQNDARVALVHARPHVGPQTLGAKAVGT